MLSTTRSRLLDAADQILGEPDPAEFAFLHVILAQCGLPYREPDLSRGFYERSNGRASMVITPGVLLDPQTRRPVMQGVPYGAKPRLLMIHLCTEATRRQSATIPVADSMSAFMRSLGLAVTGGVKGSVGRFKEQLNRLAAARLQLILDYGDHATMVNPTPMIREFDVWFPADPRQRMLWPSHITLSAEFFASLREHALPLDLRAVRALQHSARALDLYSWLVHRLPRVRRRNGDRVSWAALRGQFGPEMTDPRNFRKELLPALRQVLAVYPAAKIEQVDGGLLLRRSDPPIKRLSPAAGG